MRKFGFGGFWRSALINCLLWGAAAAAADGLRDALQATLRNHPAVSGQKAEVKASRYAADGVRSQRYPTLIAQAQQYAQGDRSAVSGEDVSQPAILRVRQPVWAFGRINDSIAVADAEVSTERADLLRIRRQLMEDTAVAYAAVRANSDRIDIARKNVTQLEALFAQIQSRVEGQLASSADARLAAARLNQARALLEHAISEWEGTREDLVGLTQVEVGTDEPVPSDLLGVDGPIDPIESAMDRSAEIRLKQMQLGQAAAEVDRAKTASMPTIYLQADKFYDQPALRDDTQASLVFEASLDGLGFAARGRTGEAVARRMAAEQDLATAKVELTREIKHLDRNRRLQTELIELQTDSLRDLESLLASYQRQYESGTKSWLDLLNVQRELFEQRRELVQAQADLQIYSLQLLARIGGLDTLAGIDERNDG
jgi:adhesin transport system outer membrane protein